MLSALKLCGALSMKLGVLDQNKVTFYMLTFDSVRSTGLVSFDHLHGKVSRRNQVKTIIALVLVVVLMLMMALVLLVLVAITPHCLLPFSYQKHLLHLTPYLRRDSLATIFKS